MHQNTGTELMPLFHGGDELLVDGRLLHQTLQVGTAFKDWIVRKITEYNFEENKDYFRAKAAAQNGSRRGGAGMNKIDYSLTLDMAKELAMLQQNEIGKICRRYLIAKEKEAKQFTNFLTPPTQLFKGLPTSKINGVTLYRFTPLMRMLGYNPNGGGNNRRNNYPNHYINIGSQVFITEAYANHLFKSSLIIKSRKAVKAMQPVLALDFGKPLEIK